MFIIHTHTLSHQSLKIHQKSKATMRALFLSSLSLFLFFTLLYQRAESQDIRADTPPRGWNSYDSYSWRITEEEFLENAKVQASVLKNHGYEYVVLGFLWYRNSSGDLNSKGLDMIDEWGRMIPDPDRWPSSKGGKGFKEVADKVHAMGLKFGIHVMGGISTQAVTTNTPILDITTGKAYEEGGRQWRAADIGLTGETCAWMNNGFMKVNNNLGASIAFLRSLYQQYADWGVDFVKNDCVNGYDQDIWQIGVVSKLLSELQRPILYSVSPGIGVHLEDMAREVGKLVNMYRITGNIWDRWEDVNSSFDLARACPDYSLIGGRGLKGKSWPDLDMLPMGWLTDATGQEGPYRSSSLSLDEQRTMMTLWSMAKSPIMFGGDLINLAPSTLDIITNPDLLEINAYSQNNGEFPYLSATLDTHQSNKKSFLTRKTKTVKEVKKMDTHTMSLTSCKNPEAKGWVIESLDDKESEQICWKYPLGSRYKPRFCLNKRKPVMTVVEEAVYEQRYKGKYHLFAADKEDLCLDGAPTTKLTSNEIHSSSFSPCKWHTNQMWELNVNGTLVNSYSGQCATMKAAVVDKMHNDYNDNHFTGWFAKGTRGEGYVAFFNRSPQRLVISVKMADVARVLPVKYICKYREIWTKTGIMTVSKVDAISMSIPSHGCALFIVNCTTKCCTKP